jgi:hypothetical protein
MRLATKNATRLIDSFLPAMRCGEIVGVLQDLGWTLSHGFNVEKNRGKCANMELRCPASDTVLAKVVVPNNDGGKVLTPTQIEDLQAATQVDFAKHSYTADSAFAWIPEYKR